MKKYILKFWPVLILLLLSSLTVWPLFLPGYFSHHDDLQVMRIFEMRKCFLDLQIPCRWVPDMGYGNGFPLYNYYSVFPYYIGAALSFFLGYIWAAKMLFFIPLILGGVSMYILGKELFGKPAGFVAGVLYLFAPYRALDSYVRGAVAESFAIAIIPLVFYFILQFIRRKSLLNFLAVSISFWVFLLNHNIMTMLFVSVLFIWVIICFLMENCKNFIPLVFSLILGFGLAAFFILPAFFEQSLIQTDTLTRFDLDFRVHFVTVSQLFFNRVWGYGASVLGPNDTLSFQLGWPHWWLVCVSSLAWVVMFSKFRKKQYIVPAAFFLAIFVLSIFMTHNKSAFIWEKIGILRFTQFPWRLLSLAIFSASILGGFTLLIFKGVVQKMLTIVIVVATVFLNWNFFTPEIFFPNMTDSEKLSGTAWETQQRAGILDYLPKTAYEPKEPAPKSPTITSGKAEITNFKNQSNKWQFQVDVLEQTNIEIPVFDFPNWQVIVNNQKYQHSHENFLGRISISLKEGDYKVEGNFKNTPIRSFSNAISLISLISILIFAFYGKTKKTFN